MMIVMKPTATEEEIQAVIDRIESVGARAHPSRGEEVTVIGAIGDREHVAAARARGRAGRRAGRADPQALQARLARSSRHGERTVARDRRAQDRRRALRADRRPVHGRVARPDARRPRASSRDAGATMFRGGAYKPRTSPYALPGPRRRRACGCSPRPRRETGLPIVTELMDARDLEPVLEVADVIQVGARNMQNYPLLAEIGRAGRRCCSSAACPRRSRSC